MIHKIYHCVLFALAFVLGAVLVFFISATFFNVDVFGLFVTSAAKVAGAFGDHLPAFNTRYGLVHINSRPGARGQHFEVTCADCKLEHKAIGPTPFRTSNAVLTGDFLKKHFDGRLELGKVSLTLSAVWDKNNVTGSFSLPRTEIYDLYQAVKSIVPEADTALINGMISGHGEFSWPNFYFAFDPNIKDFAVEGLVDDQKYGRGTFEYRAVDANGKPVVITSGEGTPNWLPMKQLGLFLPAAVVVVEDWGFAEHPGYELQSIEEATNYNKKKGEIKRGGSTLTQQLAKNLFLTNERTYARKLRELLYAVEMERELGKQRILELYLNIVEWGPNIYGAKMAAQTYFGKTPNELSAVEAAWLAGILRSPKHAYEAQFVTNRPNSSRIEQTVRKMRVISEEQKQEELKKALVFTGKR